MKKFLHSAPALVAELLQPQSGDVAATPPPDSLF
jgi:hypothetical protein